MSLTLCSLAMSHCCITIVMSSFKLVGCCRTVRPNRLLAIKTILIKASRALSHCWGSCLISWQGTWLVCLFLSVCFAKTNFGKFSGRSGQIWVLIYLIFCHFLSASNVFWRQWILSPSKRYVEIHLSRFENRRCYVIQSWYLRLESNDKHQAPLVFEKVSFYSLVSRDPC